MEPNGVRFGFTGGRDREPGPWARFVEGLGADLLSVGEAPTVFEDPYLHLALAAQQTSQLRLGTMVTMPGLRHPAVLACTMSTLQRHSGGRAYLGIGRGDFALVELGLKPFRLAELEEYALTVRALCRGDEVDYDGARFGVRWSAGPVPIWLAADGPKTLQLAGRIADGVIVANGADPGIVRHVARNLEAGARAVGRSAAELEVWYELRVDVGDPQATGINRDGLDEYGARHANYLLRTAVVPGEGTVAEQLRHKKGIDVSEDVGERLRLYRAEFSTRDAYTSGVKTNVELLDRYELREFIGQLFYVTGRREDVLRRLRGLIDAGARNFCVPLMAADPARAATMAAELFAEAGTLPAGSAP